MGRFIWPCPSYSRISSRYGSRIHPITKKKSFHTGVDMACAKGRDILAARAGVVARASYDKIYGNLVIITHDEGFSTYYAHTSKMLVKKGEQVKVGQVIAKVGSTGYSTGNHLHFEVRIHGVHKNPLLYVNDKDNLKNYNGNQKSQNKSSGKTQSTTTKKEEKKEISRVVISSVSGEKGVHSNGNFSNSITKNMAEILIQNKVIMAPVLVGDVVLTLFKKGAPGMLEFSVLKDEKLDFNEGNPVRFSYGGQAIFLGYVFQKSRKDADVISIICYDQMRYLKNKDTMIYENKTYSDLLKMIADDYQLKLGSVENTGYIIGGRIDEESTLMDILQNAADLTMMHTGKEFVLYDDVGRLTLKSMDNMMVPISICEQTCGGFVYETSIDSEVYNLVKVALDNDVTGEREVYMAQDGAAQHSFGVLSRYEKLTDENATATMARQRAQILLNGYRQKKRSLFVKQCEGDVRVRGGCSVYVWLNLGDIEIRCAMVAEKVVHTFSNGGHLMDLKLTKGGEYRFG